uniref:NADH-ubiquinone oxidoreductase chain 3 n=1 Tax=Echinobothrium harfordi TaxID=137582 RepID=R4I298_9CEST|nr:NADH dehydrogenase subunit 3 [Echinobothrium harfordi]
MFIFIFGVITAICLISVILAGVLGIYNKNSNAVINWASPYECGFSSNSLSLDSFSFTYFSLLVFFVVFDLEISLLLNLPEQGYLYSNFFFYFSFLLILSLGFVIEVFFGYVRWGY